MTEEYLEIIFLFWSVQNFGSFNCMQEATSLFLCSLSIQSSSYWWCMILEFTAKYFSVLFLDMCWRTVSHWCNDWPNITIWLFSIYYSDIQINWSILYQIKYITDDHVWFHTIIMEKLDASFKKATHSTNQFWLHSNPSIIS